MTIRLGIPPSCQHDAITAYGNKANRAGWPRFALFFGSISMDTAYTCWFDCEKRNEWVWATELLVNALSPRENNYKKTTAEMDDFFLSNRQEALSRKKAWLSIRNDDEQAGLSLPAHPYAQSGLRFRFDRSRGWGTGPVHDYYGHRGKHRNIRHALIYAAAKPARLDKLWRSRKFR